jgi:AraC-like DNA-binding protein
MQLNGSNRRTIGTIDVIWLASPIQENAPITPPGRDESFLLGIQRSGRGTVQQHGRAAHLAPGDIAMYSNAAPYQLDLHGGSEQIVLVLPAAPMRSACPGIDGLTATALKSTQPLVALLGLMADSYFAPSYTSLPPQAATHAAHALIDTAAGCILTFQGLADARRSHLSQYHLDRIRQYALAHLDDTELSVAKVGTALGLSAAHIHRIFADEVQTFSAWLWESRLQACRQALREPGMARQSIGMIASRFGFTHATHFSRAYRSRFGMTASTWRAGAED